MYWKSVTGLVAVSLAVAAAADNATTTATATATPVGFVPGTVNLAVEPVVAANTTTTNNDPKPAVMPVVSNSTSAVGGNTTTTPTDVNVTVEPTCSTEVGVDYVGNDLKSVLGRVGDCCSKCQGTSGCNAYSWSDYNGGTCWLKTGRGETKKTDGVTSGTVSTSGGPRVEENTDYVGNDVGSAAGKDVGACLDKCKGFNGCKAYTWSDYNGGTCWLKSFRGETKKQNGVHSAELPTGSTSWEWRVEEGVDYIDNDMNSVPAKTPAECQPICTAYTACRAYTWSDHNGGTCWLKAARGATKRVSGVTSGSVKYPVPPLAQCNVEQNKDYIGKDIGNAAAADASFCCQLCSVKADCEAYSWSSWEGGRCWFKSGVTGSKDNAGVVSGKVRDGAAKHIAYKIRSGEIPSRAVNLGGWLVGESWMSRQSPAWREVTWEEGWGGEYWAMGRYGQEKGNRLFEEHRARWITEDDIAEIASVGLNMVRVPVGFWIIDDIPGVPTTAISRTYARGTLKYLDKLINEWAVKYNVGVYLSLHAHQGSQNGADHSGTQEKGGVYWDDYEENQESSFRLSTILAARYKDVPSFVGLQLMNEPTDGSKINMKVVEKYYLRAYDAIRATGNDCVIGVSPLLQDQSQNTYRDFMRWPQYKNVWVEWHTYYKWGFFKQSEDEIIAAVKNYRNDHFTNWPGNWIFEGEWSLGNGEFEEKFKDKNKLKEFAQAQLQSYSEAHAGWAFWSWRHDDEFNKEADGSNFLSGWNLRQLLRHGIFTVPK